MKFYRHKLLLDENFFTRDHFPLINNRHNVTHLVRELKTSGISDHEVYKLAKKLRRLIVTFNRKDFEPLAAKSKNTGIITVSTNLSNDQIDKKLLALLSKNTPGQLLGTCHHITR